MFLDILFEIWKFTKEISVYLIGGFFLAGIVRAFFTERTVSKLLGAGGFRSVLNASLIGIPLPLCSCSVLPTAAALRSGGASRAATSSFLISTPETGADSIAISYAMLDPLMTVARPVAALFASVVTGAAELVFNPEKVAEPRLENAGPSEHENKPINRRLKEGIHYSYFVLMADLAWYLFWGLIMAGVVSYLVPQDLFASIPGGSWTAAAMVIAIGVPLYICATSSTPLAAALIAKGLSPGLALLLLLVGPATNMASMTVIYRMLGFRSLVIYLTGIVLSALACCLALDFLYAALSLNPAATMGKATEAFPEWLETVCAVALCALIAYGIQKEKIRPLLRRITA